jgi:hypothetical protein
MTEESGYQHWFTEKDRVELVREPGCLGTVVHVDRNIEDPTTVEIRWDEAPETTDIQWSNKLRKIETVFVCPHCKTGIDHIEHDYIASIAEEISKDVNGNLAYSDSTIGDSISDVFRCPLCHYETKTLGEFEKEDRR